MLNIVQPSVVAGSPKLGEAKVEYKIGTLASKNFTIKFEVGVDEEAAITSLINSINLLIPQNSTFKLPDMNSANGLNTLLKIIRDQIKSGGGNRNNIEFETIIKFLNLNIQNFASEYTMIPTTLISNLDSKNYFNSTSIIQNLYSVTFGYELVNIANPLLRRQISFTIEANPTAEDALRLINLIDAPKTN
jgi:hypothetical protein